MSEAAESLSDIARARMVETTEAAAYADLLHAAPTEWHCVAEETDAGWLLIAPPIDTLLFNRILGCGLTAPVRQAELMTLVARLRSAGVRNYGVQLSPAAEPETVSTWLAEAGFAPRDRWAKARPNPSFRNMLRAGFTVAYQRPNLMPPKT